MGLFNTIKITEKHINYVNSLLPEELNRNEFSLDDYGYLEGNIKAHLRDLNSNIKTKSNLLLTIRKEKVFDYFKIFNVPLKGKSLGLVDLGEVKKFSAKSTGNSFENGAMQYVIETAADETWAKDNSQYAEIEKVKVNLKNKVLNLYPNANAIENFTVNFRELGNSGNVFIYVCGTATIADNIKPIPTDEEINKIVNEISSLEVKIKDTSKKLKELPEWKEFKSKLKEI